MIKKGILYILLVVMLTTSALAFSWGHSPSEVHPGVFMDGIYSFPGKVGIGISDPEYNLHVVGDLIFTGTLRGGIIPWSRLSNVPQSSINTAGVVQLTDSTSSSSTSLAATANSVRQTYSLASTANSQAISALSTANNALNVANQANNQAISALSTANNALNVANNKGGTGSCPSGQYVKAVTTSGVVCGAASSEFYVVENTGRVQKGGYVAADCGQGVRISYGSISQECPNIVYSSETWGSNGARTVFVENSPYTTGERCTFITSVTCQR